jgi:hypothetical protein
MLRSLCRFGVVAAFAAVLINGCGDSKSNSNTPIDKKGEEGVELCKDGKDNDGDTMIDCADPGCQVLTACATGADGGLGPPGTEETIAACQDGKDNDNDGSVDCADTNCAGLVICVGNDGGAPGDCNCDDNLACTADTCNATTKVCGHTVKPKACVIDGQCYAENDKQGSLCQVCDPATSPTKWTPIVGGCQIGGLCYRKGEKDSTGCQICDPARSATSWSAVTTPGCIVGGRCYADGEKDTTGCDVCNVAVSTTSLQDAKAACNINGQCYQENDKHPNIACSNVVCNSLVSSTAWTVLGDECLIGGECFAANEKRYDGCAACVPSQSKTTWTSSTYDCNIGGFCYTNGETHPSGSCTSAICDKATSTSSWTIKGDECLISNRCYQIGDKTSNGCQECMPLLSKTSWSSVNAGCSIGGSCYTNGAAHPSPTCKTTTCNTSITSSAWTIGGSECLIAGQCYAAGDKAPGSCQECIPTTSKTSWTPSPNSCVINGTCYTNGTPHPDASCTGLGVTCNGAVSTTNWTISGTTGCVIGDKCYTNGTLDPTGCAKCDTAVSKTSWTPQATCSNIVIAALNGAYNGNLGGLAGANSLCANGAATAGYGGTWKAFISTSTQNLGSLVTGTNATSMPVVNIKNETLFSSWSAMLASGSGYFYSAPYYPYMYAFNGKNITTTNATPSSPPWTDGDGWTGTLPNGNVNTGYTCNDWIDSTINYRGQTTELDNRYLLLQESPNYCNYTAAVLCVRIP